MIFDGKPQNNPTPQAAVGSRQFFLVFHFFFFFFFIFSGFLDQMRQHLQFSNVLSYFIFLILQQWNAWRLYRDSLSLTGELKKIRWWSFLLISLLRCSFSSSSSSEWVSLLFLKRRSNFLSKVNSVSYGGRQFITKVTSVRLTRLWTISYRATGKEKQKFNYVIIG